jgi:hypothetical protein
MQFKISPVSKQVEAGAVRREGNSSLRWHPVPNIARVPVVSVVQAGPGSRVQPLNSSLSCPSVISGGTNGMQQIETRKRRQSFFDDFARNAIRKRAALQS